MKRIYYVLFLAIVLFSCNLKKESKYNFDFEKITDGKTLPDDWIKWGYYSPKIDTENVYSGKYSVLISSDKDDVFACAAYSFPNPVNAKRIELKGYMKIENVEGFAGFLIRVDGYSGSGSIAFKSMERDQINGTIGWKQYKIGLDIPEGADKINIAAIMGGKGKAWFDKLEVTLDGKSIENYDLTISKDKSRFKEIKNSDVIINEVSDKQTERLFKIAKVWGFMKYYHPEIAKGNYYWDKHLFEVLKLIYDDNFDQKFTKWMTDVKFSGKEVNNSDKINDIKQRLDIEWIKKSDYINSEEREWLLKLFNTKRENSHYYFSTVLNVSNVKFHNEKNYSNFDIEDDGIKLLSLFRYWNAIEYFFPYKYLIGRDWDDVLREYIPKFLKVESELDYKLLILQIIGEINDSHSYTSTYNGELYKYFGTLRLPLKLKIVDDKVVVTGVHNSLENSNVRVGDVLLEIEGDKVENLIKKYYKYTPASNKHTRMRDVSDKLVRTNYNELNLKLKSETNVYNLRTNSIDHKEYRSMKESRKSSHQILKGNIGYLYPDFIKKGKINKIINELKETEALIIDLRCYPSVSIMDEVGEFLMPNPLDFVRFSYTDYQIPGEFVMRDGDKIGGFNKDYYKGKVVVIINEETQSHAEYMTMSIKVAPNVTVIGSPSAGADGNVSYFTFAGGISARFTGLGVYYPDGSETQRVGLIPDIEIKNNIKDIREGRDRVLEKAIEICTNK